MSARQSRPWCAFQIHLRLRLESSIGLAEPIVKTSSVPALLVAVAVTSLKSADYRFRVDEKLVPTSYIPPFRSTVVDLDARPSCWVGSPFDYLLIHVPRKGLDDIAADFALCAPAGR